MELTDREDGNNTSRTGKSSGSRPEINRSSNVSGNRPEVRRSSNASGNRPEVRRSSNASENRPEVRRSSNASGNRPEVRRSSNASGNRPEVRQSSKAIGSRPKSGQSSMASGSRPDSRQVGRSASTRPKSATAVQKTRTSTGRPLEKNRAVSAGTGKKQQRKKRMPVSGSRQKGKKKKQVMLNAKAVITAAVILGLILALAVTLIMRSSMLKVRQIQEDYNVGDTFDINNYFEADSDETVIENITNDFTPDKLGMCKVKFVVRRGKLSSKKTAKINVVDDVKPYISGPDEIDVTVDQKINWSDYYTVADADPDIQGKLKSVDDIDTSTVGPVSATLVVTDWAGNTSNKEITVMVVDEGK